jgi:hypothetical protein
MARVDRCRRLGRSIEREPTRFQISGAQKQLPHLLTIGFKIKIDIATNEQHAFFRAE